MPGGLARGSPLIPRLNWQETAFAIPLLGLIEIGLQNGTTILPVFEFF
jgi:hypothetical protein